MHFLIIVKDNRTMEMTINQQVALDEALVPHASRLRIGKSNFRLRSDITSKESTLQTFDELSFEEEILTFLRYPGHSGEIKKITDKSSDEDDDNDVDDQSDVVVVDDDDDDQENEDEQDDDDQDDNDDDQDSDNDGDNLVHPKLSTNDEEAKDEESFDPIVQTLSHVEDSDDERNDDESHGMNVGGDEGPDAEDDDEELYRDVNINLEGIDSLFESTHWVDVPITTTVVPLLVTAPTLPPPSIHIISQLEAEVLTRASNSSKTSYDVAHDLSELELKKILTKKMERNKSIHRSDEQRNLYKALVDAYECDRIILDTYEDTVMLKRRLDDEDKDEEPSAGSDRGSNESAPVEEPMQTTQDLEEPSHQEFETGAADDQPVAEAFQHPEWFQKQTKPPTPDRAWNKTLPATHESIQPWISDLAKQVESHTSFNELMDTPVDFLAFLMNRLKVDTLTPELLAGPTYELMKGSCKSLVELEFFLEEVYKAETDQLDWNNLEGQQYLHNLLKPLPLIPNSRGRQVIPFDHFINNDLEYLRGGAFNRKYTTFVTKTKAADYGHIKWIEDLVPRIMGSARDVYSKRRIIAITELQIVKWHNYKHLDWITKADQSHYRRTLCFQRLLKDVYEKHCHPTACGRSSISDGTLNDVRTALDDRLKGIRMKYLPQTNWKRSDKERAAVMIQAIDKQLKTRRIMRSLEKFVGGRLYEGDFRMLQRTI
nr:hypothetical protein [Tanacetum cinerariifolium]